MYRVRGRQKAVRRAHVSAATTPRPHDAATQPEKAQALTLAKLANGGRQWKLDAAGGVDAAVGL
jgi:hypothetical protein